MRSMIHYMRIINLVQTLKLPQIKITKLDYYLLILFTGTAFVIALADRAPLDLDSISSEIRIADKFVYYWQGVVYGIFPGPYVYRIFVPYILLTINRITFLDLITIDFILKTIFLIAIQIGFFSYMRNFFSVIESLLGVFMLNTMLGFGLSFIKGPSIIETSDILNLFVMTLALIAIMKDKTSRLAIIMVVGLLNRETPLILLPLIFINDIYFRKNMYRAISILFLSLSAYFSVRFFINTGAVIEWFNFNFLQANIPFISGSFTRESFVGNFRLLLFIGPLILISLYNFKDHPKFLKISTSIIPIFLVVHYAVGNITESRLWLPLFLFIIPLVVNNLFKLARLPDGQNA